MRLLPSASSIDRDDRWGPWDRVTVLACVGERKETRMKDGTDNREEETGQSDFIIKLAKSKV